MNEPNAMTAETVCEVSPQDLIPLENQVGGHLYHREKSIGMLKHKSKGYVLKLVTKAALGERESRFYASIDSRSSLHWLRPFTAAYLGSGQLRLADGDDAGHAQPYLVLSDLTQGLQAACIMDVKIGERTWDPAAAPDKRANEDMKYQPCKKQMGFCIPGIRIHDIATGKTVNKDKNYGKKLDKDSVKSAIQLFLNASAENPPNVSLVQEIVDALRSIRRGYSAQRDVRLFSSSILIIYDAAALSAQADRNADWVRVKMIDFAHAFFADDGDDQEDTNYLRGVDSLLRIFEEFLPTC